MARKENTPSASVTGRYAARGRGRMEKRAGECEGDSEGRGWGKLFKTIIARDLITPHTTWGVVA